MDSCIGIFLFWRFVKVSGLRKYKYIITNGNMENPNMEWNGICRDCWTFLRCRFYQNIMTGPCTFLAEQDCFPCFLGGNLPVFDSYLVYGKFYRDKAFVAVGDLADHIGDTVVFRRVYWKYASGCDF